MLHPAAQCPMRIHQTDLENLLDLAGFISARALGKSKPGTQFIRAQGWGLALIEQEID